MKIKIDGEEKEITRIFEGGYLVNVETDDGADYYLAENSEEAGEKAREYWENLAQDDPKEFTYLVGENTLVQWGLGQSAGPGSTAVRSLEDWLDLWLDIPEEHFATYDGNEEYFEIKEKEIILISEEFGVDLPQSGVAYRHN